jgi:hypothetical protein
LIHLGFLGFDDSMMLVNPPKPIRKPGNPKTLFPLLCAAAEEFGVHRTHLYRVLKGQFPDHGDYAARYRAFVALHREEAR